MPATKTELGGFRIGRRVPLTLLADGLMHAAFHWSADSHVRETIGAFFESRGKLRTHTARLQTRGQGCPRSNHDATPPLLAPSLFREACGGSTQHLRVDAVQRALAGARGEEIIHDNHAH